MGQVNTHFECCVRKKEPYGGGGVCDINNSLCGDDAFYREAFYAVEEKNEGDLPNLDRFSCTCENTKYTEQIRLKMKKGHAFATFASFQLQRRLNLRKSATPVPTSPSRHRSESVRRQGLTDESGDTEWFGTTVPEWTGAGLPETGEGPYWSKGIGTGLSVRCGPDYGRTGKKTQSLGTMYEAMTCDAISANTRVTDVIGRLVKNLPPSPAVVETPDFGGGGPLQWTADCPLPRLICINMMLPYSTGFNPFSKDDSGCSFISFFHIKPETLRDCRRAHPPPAVRLFQEFCAGPAGKPGGPKDQPERSLDYRRSEKKKKLDQCSGLFKAVAYCENPEDLNAPEMLHKFNGKPALITKSGYVIKDPAGEWIEIGVDVRKFNALCRKMLSSFRDLIPRTKIHYGFMIQSVEDDEMPEGLICDLHCHSMNIIEDPVAITNK